MKDTQRHCRVVAAMLALVLTMVSFFAPQRAMAGTTGTIKGTVSDAATGAPIANARVTASSPTGSQTTTSDSHGFYALQQLIPDTYTVSFEAAGYEASSTPGVTVQQDLTQQIDEHLNKALKTIATVTSRSAGNLLKPFTGTDVYNVSGEQLNAATGGDNLHRTIYEYLTVVPGVTPIGGGANAEPSIRGGYDVDNGYELDGIPITERMTGYFTTNLTDLGIANMEVYTGGLGPNNAGNGLGVINSVIKSGTYPSFGSLAFGVSGPDFNHNLRAEYGGATLDRRLSYYFAFDAANSQNQYWSNSSHPAFPIEQVGISSGNPGFIYTRDFIANFHYKPDHRNDFQFFYQNSLFNDAVNYGLNETNNAFGLAPCPGAVAGATRSNGTGGTAPNGQTCPLGLYLTAMPSGTGNFLGHYSGIGKIQLNHIINDHSNVTFRLAENFNQYIFDQKYSDPNSPANNGAISGCPNYPYTIGAPLPSSNGTSTGRECTLDLGDYYQSRHGHQYYASIDYSTTPNENVSYKAGVGTEYDWSIRDVRYLNLFDYPGANRRSCYGRVFDFSCHNAFTDVPTHVPYFYAQGSFNLGKFTIEPGVRLSEMFYGFPKTVGGGHAVGFVAPSVLGTYRISQKNALRFSYAESGQFIGTEFVYRLNSPTYNPSKWGESAYQPQINHVTDLQWEHQFDPNTSLKVGPYFRASNNYLGFFAPFLGFQPGGVPKFGDTELQSGLHIRSFGAELGLSHVNRQDTGISYWLAGSYNNYWTQTSAFNGGQISFINFPLPDNFLKQGIYVRGYQVPLFSGTIAADIHSKGWHLLPVAYYSIHNFYNTGACVDPTVGAPYVNDCNSAAADTSTTPVLAPESQGMGYWFANATLLKDINKKYTVGVRISNLTNNQHGPTPCLSDGTGCYPFNGPTSNFTSAPNTYVYQPITQTPRAYEAFLNIHI